MLAIIDSRQPPEVVTALRQRGMTIVSLPPFPALPEPVASHPDMLLLIACGQLLVHRNYYLISQSQIDKIANEAGLEIRICDDIIGDTYPHDVLLNAAVIGRLIFGRLDALSSEIKRLAANEGLEPVNVKQGYAKCSTCIVSERAIITADPGIAAAATAHGLDVLTVRPGYVSLPGYDTGFIGGATGHDAEHVYFSGSLDTHPDAAAIRCFCRRHSKEAVSLAGGTLFDGGSMIFV